MTIILLYIGLGFRSNQSPPVSLLAAGSAQEEEEEEEEGEGEIYEMHGPMESYPRESLFGRGWRLTTTV